MDEFFMPHSEEGSTRKVISLGKASFAIILPKEWIIRQKVEKGNEVVLFPQKNGQLTIQKTGVTKKRVVLDSEIFGQDLLDTAIQSAYILNIDDTIVNFTQDENFDDEMNHLADISKKFAGLSLSISGPDEVTLSNLFNMMKLRVKDIFDQLLAILWLLVDQIERQDFDRDNASQMIQMEGKYRLGVRLLIFALRNQHLEFEAGLSDIVQVLGSRVALRSLRSLILLVNNLIPYLKDADIPKLPVIVKNFRKLTEYAVKCLFNSELSSIKQMLEYEHDLNSLTENLDNSTDILRNFFLAYFDIIASFKEVAVTRYIESLEILEEEEGKSLDTE